jgi:hypothetical protein
MGLKSPVVPTRKVPRSRIWVSFDLVWANTGPARPMEVKTKIEMYLKNVRFMCKSWEVWAMSELILILQPF